MNLSAFVLDRQRRLNEKVLNQIVEMLGEQLLLGAFLGKSSGILKVWGNIANKGDFLGHGPYADAVRDICTELVGRERFLHGYVLVPRLSSVDDGGLMIGVFLGHNIVPP